MMRALLVIDMLNDFLLESGALDCGDSARKIIPFVQTKIQEFHKKGDLVIFVRDSHQRNDLEFKMFPKHCVAGTKGAEIIHELPVTKKDIMIFKKRYSAFYNTQLDQVLKNKAVKEVYVVGVCTSICVMDTVGDLKNRDYAVTVFKRGVADFDSKAHKFSLARMEKIYGAKVI